MLGGKIKELRLKHDYTQVELSKQIGVAQTQIASWEADRTMPSHENTIKLCMAFGISLDTLFDFNINAADIWTDFIKLNEDQKKMIYTMIKSLARINDFDKAEAEANKQPENIIQI